MTRHTVWNSLPKNVDFSTLTSFRHSNFPPRVLILLNLLGRGEWRPGHSGTLLHIMPHYTAFLVKLFTIICFIIFWTFLSNLLADNF